MSLSTGKAVILLGDGGHQEPTGHERLALVFLGAPVLTGRPRHLARVWVGIEREWFSYVSVTPPLALSKERLSGAGRMSRAVGDTHPFSISLISPMNSE